MTIGEYKAWLEGFMAGMGDSKGLDYYQWKKVRDKLAEVEDYTIPQYTYTPSYPNYTSPGAWPSDASEAVPYKPVTTCDNGSGNYQISNDEMASMTSIIQKCLEKSDRVKKEAAQE